MPSYASPFVGGLLIGMVAWLIPVGLGCVTGVSGIAAAAMTSPRQSLWRCAFSLGLMLGGALFAHVFNVSVGSVTSSRWLIGRRLLVGFGTVLGGGCTGRHGVCGL